METITKVPDTKETLQFNVSFDPTNPEGSVEIKLPNGKTFTAKKKEVMKHVTRAVIKACVENNMNKKAASLRPFMKDEVPTSPKQVKLREAFLDIPVAKRAKKCKGCNSHCLTKTVGDDQGTVAKKKGNWSNDEDVSILDYAAKFDGKDVDWSVFVLSSRDSSQCKNRYKVLSRKKGDWTKDEDDAILKYGKEVGDVNWCAFILPGRIARQCNNRHKKLINRKVNKGSIKKGGWTKDEDQQILEHGTSEGDKDWQSLAENLPGRVEKQCSNRFQRLSRNKEGSSKKQVVKKKGGWTTEEDEKILIHVMSVGQKDWSILAKELPGRLPKQCCNRHNRLSKLSVDCKVGNEGHEKKRGKCWSVDEDQILQEHVKKHGAEKWKVVADQLPGRVPGGCKNRWFKHLCKEDTISEDDFEVV